MNDAAFWYSILTSQEDVFAPPQAAAREEPILVELQFDQRLCPPYLTGINRSYTWNTYVTKD